MMDCNENVMEFITGSPTCTGTFTERKYINKIKKIYAERPNDFTYYFENKDGSVTASFPKKWVKLSSTERKGRELTEEEKAALRERLARARSCGPAQNG